MERKIRVLNIVDELRRGGKERQLVELLKGIDRNKFEMYAISLLPREDGYDEEAKSLVQKFCYFNRKYKWDLTLVYKLIRYCRNNKIDIVYSWDGMTSFYSLLASYFIKSVFVSGSIRDTDTRKSYKHTYKRVVLKLSKNIVANSYAGLKTYNVEKKGKVIYNGLDLKRFENLNREKQDKFTIGIVANLTEYKDYFTFFRAIKLLSEKTNDFEVHIIGWGKKAKEYQDFAEKLGIKGYLKYFGRVSDAEKYIINFDVGVLCSYKEKGEGLSNSVLEYMACGITPIITDVGAAKEIIEDGVTGLLFEAGNAKDFAEKIYYLYKNKEIRNMIGSRAKEEVFKKFSYERFIKEIEIYYGEVTT